MKLMTLTGTDGVVLINPRAIAMVEPHNGVTTSSQVYLTDGTIVEVEEGVLAIGKLVDEADAAGINARSHQLLAALRLIADILRNRIR